MYLDALEKWNFAVLISLRT